MRNDFAELTSLNRYYINSVQNSDVKRFDEILADEFYCSNPDKSLVDRAGFLKQTVVPVTIRNLEAHDVKIRLMGDFAIIHAATRYTMPDGQQDATPIAGQGRTAAGLRCRRMFRGNVLITKSVIPGGAPARIRNLVPHNIENSGFVSLRSRPGNDELGIEHDHAAHGLAGLHRGEAFVDLRKL
jgi:hypothetical protein